MVEKHQVSGMFMHNSTWLLTWHISVFISYRSFKSWLPRWSSIHVSRKTSLNGFWRMLKYDYHDNGGHSVHHNLTLDHKLKCQPLSFQGTYYLIYDKWVPVTTAWCVLRLQMKEPPPIWRVDVNILNKQLQTAIKAWFSSLGVGWGAIAILQKFAIALVLDWCFGTTSEMEKGHWVLQEVGRGGGAWTGLIWLRIGTGGRLLWM